MQPIGTNNQVWINNNKVELGSTSDDVVVESDSVKYAFIAKSEYNTVPGVTVSQNIKKRDGADVLGNYGNTNLIVIRPNQSFY